MKPHLRFHLALALLAAMGAGAIASAAFLPRLRRRYARDALVLRGAALQGVSMAVMAMV